MSSGEITKTILTDLISNIVDLYSHHYDVDIDQAIKEGLIDPQAPLLNEYDFVHNLVKDINKQLREYYHGKDWVFTREELGEHKNTKIINILSKKEIKKLTTSRLIAYKNSLLKCNEDVDWDTLYCSSRQFVKSSKRWKKVYKDVKEVLATREHIER